MATIEANLAIFVQGAEAWNEYHQNSEEKLDISGIKFTDRDVFHRYLDGNNILSYKDVHFQRCILKEAEFTECDLTECNFRNAELIDCDFSGATLDKANFDGAKAIGANFIMAKANHARFRTCDLTDAKLSSGQFNYSLFTNAVFTDTQIRTASFVGADFTGLDNYFVRWKTNIWGIPEFPEYPNTAVDLINGLNPHTKKMISNGLYLQSLGETTKGRWPRFVLQLWGISCGYGQDVSRWMVFSMLVVVTFACLFTSIEMNVANLDVVHHCVKSIVMKPDFFTSMYYSIITFVTLGYGDIFPITTVGRIVAMIEVCIGYLMLGGLVSIFSNKLARLS